MDAAWDVQAFLEEEVPSGADAAVILLDYAKFFDSFGHKVVADLLATIGFEQSMADMIFDLNRNVRRYFKVGGKYGDPTGQDNGFGQGDPFALMIALI